MCSDAVIAWGYSLLAANKGKTMATPVKLPFPSILQELHDWVNSPYYQNLILEEKRECFKNQNQ